MHFGSVMAGVRMSNGSEIELSKLRITIYFAWGTSLRIALIYLVLDPTLFLTITQLVFGLNLTSSFFDGNCFVVYFRVLCFLKQNVIRFESVSV